MVGATLLSLGHHGDHVARGNHTGWPLTDEISAFTYSLGIYPVILVGLWLSRRGDAGASWDMAVPWSHGDRCAASRGRQRDERSDAGRIGDRPRR